MADGNTLLAGSMARSTRWTRRARNFPACSPRRRWTFACLRLTDAGNVLYSTAHSEHAVVEMTRSGEIVRKIPIPGKGYKAEQLPGGHFLTSTGDECKLIEIDADGKVISFVGGKKEHHAGAGFLFRLGRAERRQQGHGELAGPRQAGQGRSPGGVHARQQARLAVGRSQAGQADHQRQDAGVTHDENEGHSLGDGGVVGPGVRGNGDSLPEAASADADAEFPRPAVHGAGGVCGGQEPNKFPDRRPADGGGPHGLEGHARRIIPSSWRAGETKKFPFTIETGVDREDNKYPVTVHYEGGGSYLYVEQTVVLAMAPYFKPKIDGNLAEWKDAIPIAFTTSGKKTTVRTYWNRKQFCLAVEVEQDQFIGLEKASAATGMDAVQFAVGPADEADANSAARPKRYEFLLAASTAAESGGKCFLLRKPSQDAAPAKQARPLADLECKEALVAVNLAGHVTAYEAAIPMSLLEGLKADTGREFRFGLLVHDPSGTGVRDLGEVMNLWDEHRRKDAWCSWQNVKWGDKTPFDGWNEFGFCSSIH